MDYGILPPEINSGRMYAGPGSAPMLAAASAWDGLAAEVGSAATAYTTVVGELTEGAWRGSASAAMAAAAAHYITWMNAVAAQADQTAAQAQAAAAAFEAAYAMTVPPAAVAANRTQLAALVATNVLGQNTPAIAVNEALYGDMWAQDAAAMYGYAGSSAAAATVTPFGSPPETTTAASASQGGAVAQATAASSSAGVQSTLSQVVSTTPSALQALASPVQSTSFSSILPDIASAFGLQPGDITNLVSNLASSSFTPMAVAGFTQVGADSSVIRALNTIPAPGDPAGIAGGGIAAINAVGPAGPSAAATVGGAPVSAAMGQATLVAKMSVPQTWTAAAPAANTTVNSLPAAAEGWAIAPDTGMAEMAPAGMPGMPGVPGGGLGNRGYGFAAPRYGFKPAVVSRPPAAG